MARLLDPDHCCVRAGQDHRVGPHHVVILAIDPLFRGQIGRSEHLGEQLAERLGLGRSRSAARGDRCGDLRGDIGLVDRDSLEGALVSRRLVGEGQIGDLGDDRSLVADPQDLLLDHLANDDGIEIPALKDLQQLAFAALHGDDQHALLRFGEHHLVGGHARLALGHEVEIDLDPRSGARAHLAGGGGQPGRSHVLDAEDRLLTHRFEAGFEQQLLREGVADLDGRPFLHRCFIKLCRGHRRSVDPVPARLRPDVDDRVADSLRLSIEDLLPANQAEREGVDERVERIALLEVDLSADCWNAESVPVIPESLDDPSHDPPVPRDGGGRGRLARRVDLCVADRPEAQAVERGDGPGSHREDVAQNSPDAGRRSLVGLDEGGMVVRFDLEGGAPAVADLDDAGVLSRPLHQARTLGRQATQVDLR